MEPTQEIKKGELIGLKAKIVESRNRFNIGREGKIIDENKNMLILKDANGRIKKYPKGENTFEFIIQDRKIRIEGSLLTKRPEDRIK